MYIIILIKLNLKTNHVFNKNHTFAIHKFKRKIKEKENKN